MQRRGLRPGLAMLGASALLTALWRGTPAPPAERADARAAAPAKAPAPEGAGLDATPASCVARPLRVPSGAPPALSCQDARLIVREVQARFAVDSPGPQSADFAELLVGWLDPHGLWSAAPDAPPRRVLRQAAAALLDELQTADDGIPCASAERAGASLASWVDELAAIYDGGSGVRAHAAARRALLAAVEPIFEDDPVRLPARVLARSLGERLGRLEGAFPALGPELTTRARQRYFPALDVAGWSEAVLSAAVRAYVAALDPHGGWAPLDEEWSLYADEPGFDAGFRLWSRATRSAAGVRIIEQPTPPLAVADLVLAIDAVELAGMPLEQVEQLARLEPTDGAVRRARVLRAGHPAPLELELATPAELDPGDAAPFLESERIRFGTSNVLVVSLPSIADGVDEALASLIEQTSEDDAGILLDLRGNGGGSTDAALGVIALFLPDAPVFPLAWHGRVIEVMRAPPPDRTRTWRGPVATLVDGHTASAAEMIAGALAGYARGPVVGSRTFGKGCIQEYTDDPTGRGVLRLTSLLFSLPDGAPLQGVGITPSFPLPLPKVTEREATVPGALPSYRGPDVRAPALLGSPAWPEHARRLGPCRDPLVCTALARLGDPPPKPRLRRASRR